MGSSGSIGAGGTDVIGTGENVPSSGYSNPYQFQPSPNMFRPLPIQNINYQSNPTPATSAVPPTHVQAQSDWFLNLLQRYGQLYGLQGGQG